MVDLTRKWGKGRRGNKQVLADQIQAPQAEATNIRVLTASGFIPRTDLI